VNSKREGAALAGVGAVACAACCAGPIVGVLAAIGLGTLTGVLLFGAAGLAIAALALVPILRRRRRVANALATCDSGTGTGTGTGRIGPVPVSLRSRPNARR
jgi:hypothetical protein